MLKIVSSEQVISTQHIMEKVQSIHGLIFRKPGSKYMDASAFCKLVVRT